MSNVMIDSSTGALYDVEVHGVNVTIDRWSCSPTLGYPFLKSHGFYIPSNTMEYETTIKTSLGEVMHMTKKPRKHVVCEVEGGEDPNYYENVIVPILEKATNTEFPWALDYPSGKSWMLSKERNESLELNDAGVAFKSWRIRFFITDCHGDKVYLDEHDNWKLLRRMELTARSGLKTKSWIEL